MQSGSRAVAGQCKHYAYSTEKTYVYWVKRFVLYHNKRHPLEMGKTEISEFLTYLAVEEYVAASTQNQALSALLFLYREVLCKDLNLPLENERSYSPSASRASGALSAGRTLIRASTIFPSSSMTKWLRTMPMYVLPYIFFSPHTPYCSAIA
jgi:hypothetical protein